MFLNPRLINGGRVTHNVGCCSYANAINFAILSIKPHFINRRPGNGNWHRRDEPAWHDPNILIALSASLTFSNEADVNAAFSMQTRVFKDLPVFRNYFGHKNQGTRSAAVALAPLNSIAATKSPVQILFSRPILRPQPLMLDWIDDLLTTVELLCE